MAEVQVEIATPSGALVPATPGAPAKLLGGESWKHMSKTAVVPPKYQLGGNIIARGANKPIQRAFGTSVAPLRRVLGSKRLRIVSPTGSGSVDDMLRQHPSTPMHPPKGEVSGLTDSTVRNLSRELEAHQLEHKRVHPTITPSPMSVHTPIAPKKSCAHPAEVDPQRGSPSSHSTLDEEKGNRANEVEGSGLGGRAVKRGLSDTLEKTSCRTQGAFAAGVEVKRLRTGSAVEDEGV